MAECKDCKPCPFCGAEPEVGGPQKSISGTYYWIACSCGGLGPQAETVAVATTLWNRRVVARAEAYKEALVKIRANDPFHSEQDPAHVAPGFFCAGCIAAEALKETAE
jgi:Lar family restriction alleviation protein